MTCIVNESESMDQTKDLVLDLTPNYFPSIQPKDANPQGHNSIKILLITRGI